MPAFIEKIPNIAVAKICFFNINQLLKNTITTT